MFDPQRARQATLTGAKPNTRFINDAFPRPMPSTGSISFEASLRNSSVSLANRRRGWNSSNRISYQPLEYTPPVSQTSNKKSKQSLSNPRPKPSISRSNVECIPPANGTSTQTIQMLKELVDNLVHNLLKGTAQFDTESLDVLNRALSKIPRDQVEMLQPVIIRQIQSDSVLNSRISSPPDTLYQSMLWCLLFQSSVDLLSKNHVKCNISCLFERAWDYIEHLKEFFRPFIKSTNEDLSMKKFADLNQNQSNVRNCEVEIETHQRHHEPDIFIKEERLDIPPSIFHRHRKSHSCRKIHHSRHERTCHRSSKHHSCHSHRDANVGPTSSPDINCDSYRLDPSKISVKTQTLPEMVNSETQSIHYSDGPLSPISLQIHQSKLEDEYKTTRAQLANEASRYLSVFRKCQNLQKQLIRFPRNNNKPCSPMADTALPTYPVFCNESNQTLVNYPLTERHLILPVEISEELTPQLQWLPKMSTNEMPYEYISTRPQLTSAVALRMSLISLADILFYAERLRRSNSARGMGHFRRLRAIPFRRRDTQQQQLPVY